MKTNSLYSTNINLKMLNKKEVLDLTKEQSKIFKLIFTKKLKTKNTIYIYIYIYIYIHCCAKVLEQIYCLVKKYFAV